MGRGIVIQIQSSLNSKHRRNSKDKFVKGTNNCQRESTGASYRGEADRDDIRPPPEPVCSSLCKEPLKINRVMSTARKCCPFRAIQIVIDLLS